MTSILGSMPHCRRCHQSAVHMHPSLVPHAVLTFASITHDKTHFHVGFALSPSARQTARRTLGLGMGSHLLNASETEYVTTGQHTRCAIAIGLKGSLCYLTGRNRHVDRSLRCRKRRRAYRRMLHPELHTTSPTSASGTTRTKYAIAAVEEACVCLMRGCPWRNACIEDEQ